MSLPYSFAHADIINEFVKIQCNQDLNFLRIENLIVNGSVSRKYSENNQKNLWKKYNLISINSLLKINTDGYWQKNDFDTNCELQEEDKTQKNYKVNIEGYAGNHNPNGKCGGHLSFNLSISNSEDNIIEKLNFFPNCHANTQIHNVTLIPHEQYLYINGTNSEGKYFRETIWISGKYKDTLPIKNTNIYETIE